MVSVIIPTLNEARELPATLQRIHANPPPHEVIVVDAGSTDETTRLAAAAGAKVLPDHARQRAAQMNTGASQAGGEILLLLHADTWLLPTAIQTIEQVMQQAEVVGGAFRRRFRSPSVTLQITCWLADLRSRLLGWHLGDQAIFVRREVFRKLGGFREIPIFEDLDFSRSLARTGRVVTLGPPVVSSARRFERLGVWRTTARDLGLTLRYFCSPTRNSPSS